jgi:hypothetical protein
MATIFLCYPVNHKIQFAGVQDVSNTTKDRRVIPNNTIKRT